MNIIQDTIRSHPELVSLYKESITANATLDECFATIINICSSKISNHPDYDDICKTLFLQDLYRKTPSTFVDAMKILHDNRIVSDSYYADVCALGRSLDDAIVHSRDTDLSFFGLKTLQNGYMLSLGSGQPVERPQYVFMRVAVAIHGAAIGDVLETYNAMSRKHFIHATPTLFNAGARKQQFSSCFLMQMKDDSIDGLFDTMKWSALISKHAGGIGVSASNVRGKGSHILGNHGKSDGIIPLLRCFNAVARYVNQAGKRNGSIAIYLEPWHSDVEDFLQLRKNYGAEEQRTRDLFIGLWMPDLFMERVAADKEWSLMNPSDCKGLDDVWGDDFKRLYERYEREGKFVKRLPAREIFNKMIESQIETGQPYMMYKDTCNSKSNQQNLGTIKCGNLCAEVVEYVSPDEVAVCNLASVGLPSFVKDDSAYDYDALHKTVRIITRNLNKIIDRNFYPIEEARNSNLMHRPLGIGVQGLADTCVLMKIPFDSPEAIELNARISECIYHAAITESADLAERDGPYESFAGSPASKGLLQFDLWGVKPKFFDDWAQLKERIKKVGLRNSQLIALMPTASTSQILGYNECIEAFTSMIYKRKTLAGEFIMMNKYLVNTLERLGLWDEPMREKIIIANGSIADIPDIPRHVKDLFKTVWEIKQKHVMDLAAARGPYICQSQSMNLFMQDPDFGKLHSAHFYSWRAGLKTGQYYLRTRPKAQAQKFTVVPTAQVCTEEVCTLCSS